VPRSPRRIVPRLLAAAAGVAFALLAGELAVRLVRPQAVMTLTPGLYHPDPPAGYRLRPGHRGTLGNRVEFETAVAVDVRGLRIDPAQTTQEGPSARRLLAVGDSFTFGVGVEAGQAWPARAAALLAAAGMPLVGLNAGVPGYGIPDAVRWVERHGAAVGPEVVVLGVFVGNDLQNAAPSAPHMEVRDGQLVLPGERPGLRSWLYQRSQLYVLAKNALPAAAQRPLRELLGLPEPWALRELRLELELYRPQPTPLVAEGAAATGAALDRLRALARERGFVVAAVLIPSLVQVDPGAWSAVLAQLGADTAAHDPAAPTRLLAELLAGRAIPVADAAPALARAIAAGEQPYYPIDRHLTARGHEIVAALVAQTVRETLGVSAGQTEVASAWR
jgi:lysophospholipase L1-like esterase